MIACPSTPTMMSAPEPGAKLPHVASLGPDLPEQASLPERPVAGEVAIVERPDPLRDEPVEAAHPADLDLTHL